MPFKMKWVSLLLLIVVALSFSAVQAAEFSLIVENTEPQAAINAKQADEAGFFKAAVRWRRVDLIKQITMPDGIAKGDELILNLFPDTSFQATVDRVSVNAQGTMTVRGRLQNYPLGYVLISTTGDRSLASIRAPELGVEYSIVYDPNSRSHYLLDNDPAKMGNLEDAPVVIPNFSKPEEKEEIKALQERLLINEIMNDANTTVDVMVVYTPTAKEWADANSSGIDNVIAQAMEKGQLVADNSNTSMTVRMVHSEKVDYTESGSASTDLSRLQKKDDGYLDSVHDLRDTYYADLVVLFEKIDDTGGVGYLLNSSAGSPAYAFSITRVQQASTSYTTIHEIGHNMGLHHHKEQNTQPGPGLYSYSAGWRWVSTDANRYCSVMTYEDGSYFADGLTHSRVSYFSNPSLTYIGAAVGDAANGDNARTVREIKGVIAAYRTAPSVSMTFRAVTANSGAHTDMSSSNYVTVSYVKPDGTSGTANVWDGNDAAGVSVKPSSSWSYNQTSSGSGSTHRWYCNETISGTTPSSGSQTLAKNYYDQYKPTVTLSGTDSTHTVSTESHLQFGASHLESGQYGSWTDWSDAGSTLTFGQSTTGSPSRSTGDARSWTVADANAKTITYGDTAPVGAPISWGSSRIAALFSDYGSDSGIWSHNTSSWIRLTDWQPAQMIAYGTTGIMASFNKYGSGNGLYRYNGSSWSRITDWVPGDMVSYSGGNIAGKFTDYGADGNGIWRYDGGWSRLTDWTPDLMTTLDNNTLVGKFSNYSSGNGVYKHDSSAWSRLTDWLPDGMSAWGSRLAAVFSNYGSSGNGLWIYDGSWKRATDWTPTKVLPWKNDTLLAGIFSQYGSGNGLYSYNGTSWTRLTEWVPTNMAKLGTDDLVAVFTDYGSSGNGIWKYTSGTSSWQRLTDWVPENISSSGDYITAVFTNYGSGGNGVWKYSGGAWTRLTDWTPKEPRP